MFTVNQVKMLVITKNDKQGPHDVGVQLLRVVKLNWCVEMTP